MLCALRDVRACSPHVQGVRDRRRPRGAEAAVKVREGKANQESGDVLRLEKSKEEVRMNNVNIALTMFEINYRVCTYNKVCAFRR